MCGKAHEHGEKHNQMTDSKDHGGHNLYLNGDGMSCSTGSYCAVPQAARPAVTQ